MPIRLICDAEDNRRAFVLYDPAAIGDARGDTLDPEASRELVRNGRAVIHVGRGGNQSPDNPGAERRIAWVCVDEPLPEELADRCEKVVSGSRLQVPSGKLYFSSAYAMRGDGPPERPGLLFGTADIEPGDYHLDVYLADWADGEREEFVRERTRPSDLIAEHRLGCLAWFALATGVVVPVGLLFLYFGLPAVGSYEPVPHLWLYALTALTVIWMTVFAWGQAPSQQRIIAAREARRAMNLPAPVYVLESREPGDRPAMHREATDRARPVLS